MAVFDDLRAHLIANQQQQLANHLDSLGADTAAGQALSAHLAQFNFGLLGAAFKQAMNPRVPSAEAIRPVPAAQCVDRAQLDDTAQKAFRERGLKAIAEGQVGAIVLAGGQASRLGSVMPKGILPLGLALNGQFPVAYSLLHVQAAQIARLQREARALFPSEAARTGGRITWLLMTSRSTDAATCAYLDGVLTEAGLQQEQVLIFVQGEMPAFDLEGRVLLKNPTELVTAPDGNGGMYAAIRPLLPVLAQRGVRLLNIYCVDNILCRVADPLVVGCALQRGADCVLKVIEKREPGEQVGHVCLEGGRLRVLEYSEIPAALAERRDPNFPAKLFLRAGSIANHFVTLDLLREMCAIDTACPLSSSLLPHHAARKRVAHWHAPAPPPAPNAVKLERFIFDPFCTAKNVLVWQVPAGQEFSPLKNAESAGRDCMSTCVRAFQDEPYAQWLRDACAQCMQMAEAREAQ